MSVEILDRKELRKKVKLSDATIWRLRRQKMFPEPVKLSARRVGWRLSDVDTWLKNGGVAASDGPL
ncbi:MAG TPA: AlpA family phage regulatory protein [Candidatus Binataceae bacterium]|jgi:predicted DNA-binding transcriptional regulator AlpA|nr:AlpA family phage regulatory protein [Candidatus Binataceae bacterium]